MIQIPFSGDAESTEPLRRCIQRAAHQMNASEFHAALLMSHFLEELSHQVAKNCVVRVPGFGVFGAKVWHPRHDPDALPYAYPAFSASVALRNLVSLQCPPTGAALDAIDRHRRHSHASSGHDRSGRVPWSAHKAFRERITAQAKRLGFET
jgi:hypothetical protein